ncbi:MAG: chemotaxis protein [Firmicutes bacterium]|nr:chemotaxis protein [Bacillota bacterium]
MTNVAIIGGGKGGVSILKAFYGIGQFKVIGICDIDPNAPGLVMARELDIPVYQDLGDILLQPGLELVIEATGSAQVRDRILSLKAERTAVADSQVANAMITLTEAHESSIKQLHSKKEAFKTSAPFLTKTYDSGVIYFTTDLERYDYVEKKDVDVPGIKVGESIIEDGFIRQCIKTKKEVTGTVDSRVYGTRMKTWVLPIFFDDDPQRVTGTYGVFIPKIHPVYKAFDVFAPIVVQCQPEGALVMATDAETLTHRLGSDKFDLPLPVGYRFKEGDATPIIMRKKARGVVDIETKKYGPAQIIGLPLFDDETGDIIGTFGLAIPRKMARDLQDAAAKLNSAAHEMAGVMQEIASSANQINLNEGVLVDNVRQVQGISGQINDILLFIKNVADQTKMLGLNAAIEAARAGDHGRGFGVVAEEIRKLSDQSKDTAEQIGTLTREIQDKIGVIARASENSVKQSQEQAAATQEVTASVNEMAELAGKLMELARSI